jgi:hypothetical protein
MVVRGPVHRAATRVRLCVRGGPDPVPAGDVPHRASIRGDRHRLAGGRVK